MARRGESNLNSASERLYRGLGLAPEGNMESKLHTNTKVFISPTAGIKKAPPPVSPKPVLKPQTTKSPSSFRRQQPSNTTEAELEDELDALTDLLVKNLENTGDPDFYGMCNKCGEKVSGEGTGCTAMEKLFHIKCFICDTCGCQLTGKVFYAVDKKVLCEPDYLNSLETCCVCQQAITDRILRATGKPYHPACFRCIECGKNLDGIQFTVDAMNSVHCIEDYYRKYSPRCASCHHLILPDKGQEETVRIVSMDKDFHVDCFKCEDCDAPLSSEKQGLGCYPLDGHLLCQTCNGTRVQKMTKNLGPTTSTPVPHRTLTTEL